MLCRGAFQPVCPLPRWRTLRCFRLVCFHCLRVRLSWRTRRGGGGLEQRRRGRSRSSRGHSGGQAGGTPGPERAVGVGWAVLWRKGCQRAPPEVYPYSDYGVQLPSEGRGSTPPTFCTCCLSPLLCSLGAPLVALLSKNGQTSRSLCLGSSGVATAQNGGEAPARWPMAWLPGRATQPEKLSPVTLPPDRGWIFVSSHWGPPWLEVARNPVSTESPTRPPSSSSWAGTGKRRSLPWSRLAA